MKSQKLALGLVLSALAIGVLIWMLKPSESYPDPVIKGRLVSEWTRDQVVSNDWQVARTLKEIGSPAVPHLVKYLNKGDSVFNSAYVKLWPSLPQFARSRLPAAALARDMRMNAVVALRDMGPPASNAVPALIERLADKDRSISLHSAIALGNIGSPASPAVPALQPFLSSTGYTVRVYTASALWKIQSNAVEVLPVLEKALKEERQAFCWAAAVFVGEMGPAASNAIPSLAVLSKSSNLEAASSAVQALASISPETMPLLIETLNHTDAGMRISACVALGRLGTNAVLAAPALKALLADQGMGAPTIMGRSSQPTKVGDEAAEALSKIESK